MTVEDYLEGRNPEAVELFRRFQQLVERCGPSELAPRRTIVYWKRERVFVGAFANGRRRLRITEPEQLDESIAALLAEAYREVGPGTRGLH